MQTTLHNYSPIDVIESLRLGRPPKVGVSEYSVGYEDLIADIVKYHISSISDRGIIRFANGSWGSGKTHFLRVLAEACFRNNCLVSFVELGIDSAALNKFETVFKAIVQNVTTPSNYGDDADVAVKLGRVLEESLAYLALGGHKLTRGIEHGAVSAACEKLMSDAGIDIDFRKAVKKYWETYQPDGPDPIVIEQSRGELLQWFMAEGSVTEFRRKFGIAKVINKGNAKRMLQSLAAFIRLCGYSGLVILFDEAEQAYSVMRKAALKDAHNNLLSLINNIESSKGLFLVYATTPDFYNDEKHGIKIYGALSSRIGSPDNKPPRARGTIWDLDAFETAKEQNIAAVLKIRDIYRQAYQEDSLELPDDAEMTAFIETLRMEHSRAAPIRFWRVLVMGLIRKFESCEEGEALDGEQIYADIMAKAREA